MLCGLVPPDEGDQLRGVDHAPAALGGLDLLVFTGGLGEHAARIRAGVCEGLAHLGITIDSYRNDSNQDTISTADSRCRVRVIPTNENLMVARHTSRMAFPAKD